MFSTLLESEAVEVRRTGGTLTSIVVHVGIVSALVFVTANAHQTPLPIESIERVHINPVIAPPPPTPTPLSQAPVYTNTPAARGFQTLVAPIDIPSLIPNIDLSKSPTNADDFTARGVPNGLASGINGSTNATIPVNGIYSELQVDRPVVVAPGSVAPTYPDMLRSAGIDGSVLAQFVVDSAGRADMATFVTLRSDQPQFAASVRSALSHMRFIPAEAGGRKVSQLVQQTFQFSVVREDER